MASPTPGALEVLGAMQPLEDAEQLVRVLHAEADAVVADEDDRMPVLLDRSHLDHRAGARPRVLDRVGQQVGHDDFHQRRIALDERQRLDAAIRCRARRCRAAARW